MKYLIVLLLLVADAKVHAQCVYSISGQVTGKNPGAVVPFVTVLLVEKNQSVLSDSVGRYRFDNLCAGRYTLKFASTGYDAVSASMLLEGNSHFDQTLKTNASQLAEVEVVGEQKQAISTNANSQLKGLALFQTSGQTLGEALKNVPGLNSIQTGPSISKPVIHGLHSNRILILNNGVRQEGQQWGSEHAPEIDPFVADKITIIKGAASVRYGSDALVGVLLVEPRTLAPAKTFDGELNLVAGSNGRMGAVSLLTEGKVAQVPGLNWRVQGTLKEAGNFRTSSYYLGNTGLKEKDFPSLRTTTINQDHSARKFTSANIITRSAFSTDPTWETSMISMLPSPGPNPLRRLFSLTK